MLKLDRADESIPRKSLDKRVSLLSPSTIPLSPEPKVSKKVISHDPVVESQYRTMQELQDEDT